jgi:hypothetical protein
MRNIQILEPCTAVLNFDSVSFECDADVFCDGGAGEFEVDDFFKFYFAIGNCLALPCRLLLA